MPASDSTAKRPRGPYAKGQARRQELIDQALGLFATQGFQRLSLRAIAESLGVSHAALSYYFPAKQDLLRAVLDAQAERERPIFAPALAERGLLDVVGDLIRQNAEIPGIIQLDVSLLGEAHQRGHIAHDWAQQRIDDSNAVARRELEKEQERGRLRPDLDLDVTAIQLTSLARGLQLQWLYNPDLPVAEHLDAFLNLLRVEESPLVEPTQ